jgi:hypothetical protein
MIIVAGTAGAAAAGLAAGVPAGAQGSGRPGGVGHAGTARACPGRSSLAHSAWQAEQNKLVVV